MQYLPISVNSFVVFVEHVQGVFLCIFEFAPAPRCVFEVFANVGLQARLFGGLFGLLAGRRKTLFSELCNICAIFHRYLSDNDLKNLCHDCAIFRICFLKYLSLQVERPF